MDSPAKTHADVNPSGRTIASMAPPPTLQKFCPACGQALVVPLHDLNATFACPRCGTSHVVATFADRAQPIPVSPVASTPPMASAPYPPAASPPTPSALRSNADALISVGAAAVGGGIAGARTLTDGVLRAADWIDARLGDRRGQVLVGAALLGVVVQLFGDREHHAAVGIFAALLFVAAVGVVALAFVARCRTETGTFEWELVAERLRDLTLPVREAWIDLREAPWAIRAQHLGRVTAALGIVAAEVLILASQSGLVDVDTRGIIWTLWASGLGVIAWAWGWWEERQPQSAQPAHGAVLRGTDRLGPLPPVVWNDAARIPRSPDARVNALLEHLCAWRPGSYAREHEYRDHLHYSLRRRRTGMTVHREYPITSAHGGRRFFDLALFSEGRAVAVELKVRFSSGDCDRAQGQVASYLRTDVDAVVLVLFDPRGDEAPVRELLDKIAEMRRHGAPVVAVVATTTGAKGSVASDATMAAMPLSAPPATTRVRHLALAAATATTIFAAWFGAHPPQGLRALDTPTSSQAAGLQAAVASSMPSQAAPCIAVTIGRFHLRPRVTLASIGAVYPGNTRLLVFEYAGLVRGTSRLFRVQAPDGASGYAFLAPAELAGACDR